MEGMKIDTGYEPIKNDDAFWLNLYNRNADVLGKMYMLRRQEIADDQQEKRNIRAKQVGLLALPSSFTTEGMLDGDDKNYVDSFSKRFKQRADDLLLQDALGTNQEGWGDRVNSLMQEYYNAMKDEKLMKIMATNKSFQDLVKKQTEIYKDPTKFNGNAYNKYSQFFADIKKDYNDGKITYEQMLQRTKAIESQMGSYTNWDELFKDEFKTLPIATVSHYDFNSYQTITKEDLDDRFITAMVTKMAQHAGYGGSGYLKAMEFIKPAVFDKKSGAVIKPAERVNFNQFAKMSEEERKEYTVKQFITDPTVCDGDDFCINAVSTINAHRPNSKYEKKVEKDIFNKDKELKQQWIIHKDSQKFTVYLEELKNKLTQFQNDNTALNEIYKSEYSKVLDIYYNKDTPPELKQLAGSILETLKSGIAGKHDGSQVVTTTNIAEPGQDFKNVVTGHIDGTNPSSNPFIATRLMTDADNFNAYIQSNATEEQAYNIIRNYVEAKALQSKHFDKDVFTYNEQGRPILKPEAGDELKGLVRYGLSKIRSNRAYADKPLHVNKIIEQGGGALFSHGRELFNQLGYISASGKRATIKWSSLLKRMEEKITDKAVKFFEDNKDGIGYTSSQTTNLPYTTKSEIARMMSNNLKMFAVRGREGYVTLTPDYVRGAIIVNSVGMQKGDIVFNVSFKDKNNTAKTIDAIYVGRDKDDVWNKISQQTRQADKSPLVFNHNANENRGLASSYSLASVAELFRNQVNTLQKLVNEGQSFMVFDFNVRGGYKDRVERNIVDGNGVKIGTYSYEPDNDNMKGIKNNVITVTIKNYQGQPVTFKYNIFNTRENAGDMLLNAYHSTIVAKKNNNKTNK